MMMDDRGDLPPMPEASDGLAEPIDPLQGQSHPEPDPDGLVEDSMRTAFDVWHRLVEDATNVGVKNLTFTEVISSRSVKDVLPSVARKSGSGMESSPWSAVGGSADSSTGFVGSFQPERHGRHGSRTPRSKVRDAAVGHERRDARRYTPNGTKVLDGPPPEAKDPTLQRHHSQLLLWMFRGRWDEWQLPQ